MSGAAAGSVAAILAGGRGTRMAAGDAGQGGRRGVDLAAEAHSAVVKGLLQVDGERIIDRQLAVLRPRFAEVLIAANDPAPWAALGLRVVPDRAFDRGPAAAPVRLGPLAGLDAILAALRDDSQSVVCIAGDMPFLQPALVERLRDAAPGALAVVPRVAGQAEPLLARYARAVAPVVAEQIAAGRYAMVDLLARLEVTWLDEPELRALDPELRSIVNVNTRADLARLDPPARS